MQIESKIKELLASYLEDEKYYVVDVRVSASKVNTKIIILLDSDAGITIDECAEISRKLGHDLEEQQVIPNAYNLEVSSPGIDTPLKFFRQYQKNIGRNLKVVLLNGSEKIGKLIGIENNELQSISILNEPTKKLKKNEVLEPVLIPFSEIKEATVLISFK